MLVSVTDAEGVMVQARSAAPAKNASSSAAAVEARKLMGTDELNWTSFQSAVSCMLPNKVASDLLEHGRAHYFSPVSKKWRDALRDRERSRRYVYGGKVLGAL